MYYFVNIYLFVFFLQFLKHSFGHCRMTKLLLYHLQYLHWLLLKTVLKKSIDERGQVIPQYNWWARRNLDPCSPQWKERSLWEWSSPRELLWYGLEGDHHVSDNTIRKRKKAGGRYLRVHSSPQQSKQTSKSCNGQISENKLRLWYELLFVPLKLSSIPLHRTLTV